ncbi:hypothetical protein AHAS_Ahas06G0258900 [Arachis hypogaea]
MTMVVSYVKVRDVVEAKRLFDEMPQRNVASWNAMIWDFVKVGDLGNARVVLDAMPEKSVASFTIMIDGYAKAGDMATSRFLFDQASKTNIGKKCSVPALQGFEHVYGDIVSGVIDVNELGFLVKHMEGMVRKMDRIDLEGTMIRVFDINKILLSKWVLFAKFYCTIEPVQEITDATRMVCKTMMSCPPVALDTALNQTGL